MGIKLRVKLGKLLEPYAPVATTFLSTSVIEVFVPALQALASTFSRRVRRGLLVEFPSRRGY